MNFFDEKNKLISSDKINVKVINPKALNDAGAVGKVKIPSEITYNEYNIKKFAEYVNINDVIKNINSKFKNEIKQMKKENLVKSSILTKQNYLEFFEASKIAIEEQRSKYNSNRLYKFHTCLSTLENNENNKIVDEKISELKKVNTRLRSEQAKKENDEQYLSDIAHLIPTNSKIDSLVEAEPSRLRGFGDPAAIAYAKKYAWNANTKSYVYLNLDCTNFVSQIVKAGGRPMNNTWKYSKSLGASNNYSTYAWKNADGFRKYYKPAYSSTNFKNFSYNVFPGTAIVADWDKDGKADHAGWVTQANSTYKTYTDQSVKKRTYMNFVVAQHTSNYHRWVSNNGNNWETKTGINYVIYFQ